MSIFPTVTRALRRSLRAAAAGQRNVELVPALRQHGE